VTIANDDRPVLIYRKNDPEMEQIEANNQGDFRVSHLERDQPSGGSVPVLIYNHHSFYGATDIRWFMEHAWQRVKDQKASQR
jgi:hypothetical protein